MKSLTRILFTGANGVLARSVIPELTGEYLVRATDRANSSFASDYHQGDLMNFSEVLSLTEGVDAIVHFAVATNNEREKSDMPESGNAIHPFDEGMLTVNVQGLFHLFEAARRTGVKKIIFASSLTVYFGNKDHALYEASMLPDPQSLYACTKVFGENLARLFAREHGISIICLRIGQPYPVGHFLDDVWLTNRKARSSYVAIEDVVSAVRCALETNVPFGIYNVVSACDNPRFAVSAASEIGYRPRGYFSGDGLAFYEDGNFPVLQK